MTSAKTIKKLLEANKTNDTKISIYIPTHPKSNGSSVHEDKTLLKNAIQEISAKLPKHESSLHRIVEKLNGLLAEEELWLHQDLSLAIFASEDIFETIKMPIETTPHFSVGKEFILNPLLAIESMDFSCLAFDMNLETPRLFSANVKSMQLLKSYKFKSMSEIMEQDYQQN